LLALLAAGIVAASHPQLLLAGAVGAVGAHLAYLAVCTLRGRWGKRRLNSLAARVAPGLYRGTRGDRTGPGRSVPDRVVRSIRK
jgi:hypothetical protein